ncbi:MAG TPA: type I methionyl aminopeptidase, partial [Chloroflexota bacterium]|nr:type I methionyl aminopeptidase [Chloroflexota bacterium]
MSIGSKRDLEGMKAAGRAVAAAIREMRRAVRPGMTTKQLDLIGENLLTGLGARSAPQMVYKFPGFCCISVNDEAVHGIPGPRVLNAGDLVKLDVTAELHGYIADACVTVVISPAQPEAEALADAARKAFYKGLEHVQAGKPIRDWGKAVDHEVRGAGFSVLKDLCGHGVGRTIHEAPRNIFNYDEPRMRERFVDGSVIAIEPIISAGTNKVVTDADGWTL